MAAITTRCSPTASTRKTTASFETPAQLRTALEELYHEQIAPAKEKGLAAAVYTQISDVEDELNGLMTYDRRVVKIAPEILKTIVDMGK